MLGLAVLSLIVVVIGVAASREMGDGQSELENHVSRRDVSQGTWRGPGGRGGGARAY